MPLESFSRLAIVIPAYKPSSGLVDLVRTLTSKSAVPILIVDDGSGPSFAAVFDAVVRFPQVTLLRHAVNLGKGSALKTAFNFALCEFPELTGVVTADADGQHHPEDIESVAGALATSPGSLVLGSRQFGADVPLRSRFGNILTRGIMHALLGRKLTDTQTGLRGIPASLLPRLLRVEATGYEFELEMLLVAHHLAIPVLEQPIRTIYEAGNASSHFNPIIDSMKIYFVLLRFGSISMMTAIIDNLVFILAQSRGLEVLPSQVLGRILAVAFNYSMVRRSVFYSKQAHTTVLPKYLALVLVSGTASYAGIQTLRSHFGMAAIPAKLLVETFLFFVNFAVQRLLIFRHQETVPEAERKIPNLFGLLVGAVFLLLLGAEYHGFASVNLFGQEIWYPVGLKRFSNYTGIFLAFSVPMLLMMPWAFTGFWTMLLVVLTAASIGPQPTLAAAFFILSACALGSKLLGAADNDLEDHLLGTLLGSGVYIFLMTLVARLPVNTPIAWGVVLALPLLLDFAGVRGRLRHWIQLIRDAELRDVWVRATFGVVLFLLIAHWFVALKPEISADGLAMHLAVPMDIAANHRMTFEPSRFLWSVMPMGADWCYSIVYLFGGEYATHLLVWILLAILCTTLYGLLRRVACSAISLLMVAAFLATPMVQLVTGALFVENLLACMILGLVTAIWRFRETGRLRYFYVALALGGSAMSIKIGALAFLVPALLFLATEVGRSWRSLGRRPAAALGAGIVLLLGTALPTYAIAYAKTRNPVFPFRNEKFHSPLLDPEAEIKDARFRQPVRWTTLYDLTFHTADYYEGQNGSFGFQYLIIIPLALLGLAAAPRNASASGAIAIAASILVFRSEPNARYMYSALPLFLPPFAALLAWLQSQHGVLFRGVVAATVSGILLSIWFLPASSYYNKDFCLRLPFSRAERARYVKEAAPVRDVIAYYNRAHPNSAVLFTHESTIAGTSGDVYENHWHQVATLFRIRKTGTVAEMMAVMKEWKIGWFIAHKPWPGEKIRPPALAKLVELCTVPEYQQGDTYLARLNPDCDLTALSARPPDRPTIVVTRGSYDDFDPVVVFKGDWEHDEQFKQPIRQTISYTDTPGAEIDVAFEGSALHWIFTKAPNRGKAEVFIDGVNKGVVDLYAPIDEWQSRARFCCFGPGRHDVVIRVTGAKNPAASGSFVDLDMFVVE